MSTALIVDDNAETLVKLARVFREKGYATETSSTLSATREALLRRLPEVALLNETVGGDSTLDLLLTLDLSRVVELYLMSDRASVSVATRAMRVGISDYFEKPVDQERLAKNLDSLQQESSPAIDLDLAGDKSGQGLLIGESDPMRRLTRLIRKVAPDDVSVLLAGESGTGKELAARTLHALSHRADREFVAVNCGAVPAELMESELFGHIKGSFTGATQNRRGIFRRADGGTLFLDEITELAPGLQAKLLRALEAQVVTPVGGEKEIPVNVRVVSATNRDPQEAVDDGVLREDLYFRLAQFPVRVPPLRERSSDIELLADYFLKEQNEERGIDKTFNADVIEIFNLHDWPGNVRELRNVIIHGHLLAGSEIAVDDLPEYLPQVDSQGGRGFRTQIGMSLEEVERKHLLATLAHFGGEKKKSAEVLGISLKTLYNRLKKYGVS
ncbi:MAG: sigma-54 dependent transcriptional regulator [Gammaproteobacteria bacterium]